MSAVQAVFDTCELLEMILLCLAPSDVNRAMRVCGTWHALIKTSSRLHNHRVLQPMRNPPYNIQKPQYRSDEPIRVHNLFNTFEEPYLDPATGVQHIRISYRLRRWEVSDAELETVEHEHAFQPPCAKVLLELYRRSAGRESAEALEVAGGVRVKDIVDAGERMELASRREQEKGWPQFFVQGLFMSCARAA